jgi:putative IMPACT (imprinted ancient) family translation regulator
LVRAYGEAATLALREAGRKTQLITAPLSLSVEHPQVSQIMHTASRCGARVADTRYDDVVHFRLEIRRSRLEALREELIQATSGGVRFED